MKYKGFTLIEILVAMSVMLSATGFIVVSYNSFNTSEKLRQTGKTLRNNLRFIQTRAASGLKPDQGASCTTLRGYQVTFTEGSYAYAALCDGVEPQGGVTIALPAEVKFQPVPSPLTFQVLTGNSNASSVIALAGGAKGYQIYVDSSGDISDLGNQPVITIVPTLRPDDPNATPTPTGQPPTATLQPTNNTYATRTPMPTSTPAPTATTQPTSTPRPTNTPLPTNTPMPTSTPVPSTTQLMTNGAFNTCSASPWAENDNKGILTVTVPSNIYTESCAMRLACSLGDCKGAASVYNDVANTVSGNFIGKTLTLSGKIYSQTGTSNVSVYLWALNSSNGEITKTTAAYTIPATTQSGPSGSYTYQAVNQSLLVPANTAKARVEVYVGAVPTALYLEDFSLTVPAP